MVDAGGILVVCEYAMGQRDILYRGNGFTAKKEGDVLETQLHCRKSHTVTAGGILVAVTVLAGWTLSVVTVLAGCTLSVVTVLAG
jgi:hypothetical protein